jgi:hypothetical protein
MKPRPARFIFNSPEILRIAVWDTEGDQLGGNLGAVLTAFLSVNHYAI